MFYQAGPVSSQLSNYPLPPQFLLISNKTKIAGEHSWHWVVCSPSETRNARLCWSCRVPPPIILSYSSDLFFSPAYCVSHFQSSSFWNPPDPSRPLFNVTGAHILPNTWSRLLLLVSSPGQHRDEWLHSGCRSGFNFPAQRIPSLI